MIRKQRAEGRREPHDWPTGVDSTLITEPAPSGSREFPGRNGQQTQKHLTRWIVVDLGWRLVDDEAALRICEGS